MKSKSFRHHLSPYDKKRMEEKADPGPTDPRIEKDEKRKKYNIGGKAGFGAAKRRPKRKPKFGEQPARKRKSNPIRTKDLEAKEDVMRSEIKPNELVLSIGKKEGPANKYSKFRKMSFSKGGRARHNIGGRANLLEEMGRLDAEKMNPNRRAEKHRVIGELNKGYKSGGAVLKGKKVGCQIK